MSVSRGNWSNLSRLAKQWIEDDEEEQKREKRRRHRDISSTANRIVEVSSEHDNPCTNLVTSLDNEEEEQENQTSTEPQRQAQGTQHGFENSMKGHKEEFENKKVHYDKTFGLLSLKEENENHSSSNTDIQEQEKPNQSNWNSDRQRENKLQNNLNEKCQEPENSEVKQQTYGIVKESNQEPNRQKENQMVKQQDIQHEDISTERNNNIQKPNAAKHWKNSASFSHSVVEKPSDPEIKKSGLATSSTSGNTLFRSQVFVSSVKIQRHQSGITSPPPIPEEPIEVPFATTAMSYKQDMASLQTSSPFKRFTPLTSSVKIGRLSKTESENQVSSGLRRSSSLRLSLRKIDDRVEKYTSAIKKSTSVKIPTTQNQGVLGVSDGLLSKRSIFEKEESATKSNITKKDLNLPGDVASRINQWSNKIQQSSSASSGLKEIKTGDVASKRMLWQQRSQSSSDTKL